jgi:hypothetical protein
MKAVDRRIAFDFDVGNITRSPCRDCPRHYRFPACMEKCRTLDRFQRVLADMVSCARQSDPESYPICRPSA